MKAPKPIYDYSNYREYLQEYIAYTKSKNAKFTQAIFANEIGFKSASFLTYILDGRRNLSSSSLFLVVNALKFSKKESDFFAALVNYNQAKKVEEQVFYKKEMDKLRKKTKVYMLNRKQYDYFDHWYNFVIRELVVISDWNGDYAKLASYVHPKITEKEAKESVKLLLELDLIKEIDGDYSLTENAINAENIPNYVLADIKYKFILKALECSDLFSPEKKHVSSSTLTLTKENYNKVNSMLNNFHNELAQVVNSQNGEGEEVYQMNFQLFPLSDIQKEW